MEVLRELDGEVKCIASSGYSNDSIMADYGRYGFSGIMTKPYKLEDLKRVLDHVMMG
jgi:hypothetical protein